MQIDPRANSAERLVAPAPLPHISRRALKRVKNPLPAPTDCRYCAGAVHLVCNSAIYHGRSYGDWPFAYLCSDCGSYVGLHPDTDVPLGTLANAQLRAARNKSKAAFHAHMKRMGLSRTGAYQWLAAQMGIFVEQCHFGWFELEACAIAERFSIEATWSTSMSTAFAKARGAS
ncbi:MAG TPA: zinc-finger-containing protein [Pseudomonas sp.]|uniref:zinc-finger-containing protein n=1 Tax=Pseudomonas sp. TaxID=306 RepID=UPI002CEDECF1|nr:zinc-finger-containing protein [Pseudomonas sp.]HWH86187.1 zinc-finger-containing protein [Pseudomonas sp.]